jgi:two-component system response regulator PilR (NtrC family)
MNEGRILVVDDEASTCAMLADYFSSVGYEVVTAADGEEALQKFTPNRFDCVITDLMMPRIDGLELLKRIRQIDRQALFLIITGFPGIDSAVNAMKEGAYDYITKPFHLEDIRLKLERALHARRTELSLRRVKTFFLTLIILTPVLISLGILLGLWWKR